MNRRRFLQNSVAATFAGAWACSTARGQSDGIKRVALVAGVAKYEKDGFSNLDYAEADARDLAAELEKHGFTVSRVIGADATRAQLEASLTSFFAATKTLSKDDVVVIALSGHGRQALQGTEEHPFFCPYDAHPKDVSTMLSLNWLMDRLKEDSASSQNLLLVDACRDNPSRGGKGVDGSTVTGLPNKLSILFSSSAGKQSYEADEIKHGIFTHFVLDGLRGQAADSDGDVTWLALANYVMKQVRKQAPQWVQREQEPNLLGNLVRQPVLARLARGTPPSATSRPPLLVAPFGEATAKAAQRAWAEYLKIDVVSTNKLGMQFALIPPGEYLMGSSAADVAAVMAAVTPDSGFKVEYAQDEQPPHRVRITQPFQLGVYEVTQHEWQDVMGTQPSHFSKSGNGKEAVSGWDTSRFPVENVSWENATEFCRKLSSREGVMYRLPAEAEWEYACRAGTTSAFHFGNVSNGAQANVYSNYPYGTTTKGPYLERTSRAGSYGANSFGLHDMHGNVWEWCRDGYDAKFYGRTRTDDPENGHSVEFRVLRGGAWNLNSWFSRSADRYGRSTVHRLPSYGLRVCRAVR